MVSSPFGWFEWFCDDGCVVYAIDAIQRPNFCSHKLDFHHFITTFHQSQTTSKMLFVFPALAANFLAVTLMASKKKSARAPKTLYNEKGETDSWTGATKFQTDLIKNPVENGLIANMKVDEVKVNYPAFKGFSNACLSNKISNLKRTHSKNVDKRGKSKLTFCFFILTFSF